MDLENILPIVQQHLSDLRCRSCLVGGLAVSVRGEPRFTKDIDLSVVVASDEEAEQLVYSLTMLGYQLLALVEQTAKGRIATARLTHPTFGGIVVDLLMCSSGIEEDVVNGSTLVEVFPGQSIPVASRGHLMALKILARDATRRPQDQLDLVVMYQRSTQADREQTAQALTDIAARGFARERNLLAAWQEFLSSQGAV